MKKIMYGVTDFALMRRENAYFVDRTGLVRELEKTRYAMFLRPRVLRRLARRARHSEDVVMCEEMSDAGGHRKSQQEG